jgi:exocyst complex component 1
MLAVFEAIPRIGVEHPKTPQQIVKMGKIYYFPQIKLYSLCVSYPENFHRLHGVLSRLKIAALDSYKKDSKQRYQDALKAYVTHYFGRPLEKLNVSPEC